MPINLRDALLAAAAALESGADDLNRLDSYAGDGDLGVTMTAVAAAVRKVVEANDATGPAQILSACGAAIAREAPSTSGTLTATGLLRASKALSAQPGAEPGEAPPEGDVAVLGRCFAAAAEGVQARGKATVGDRTLLDGLDAVRASLAASATEGSELPGALQRAATAAQTAAEGTASMEPKAGRASWVPQRALGHPDAGCAMLAMVMQAVAARS